MEIHHCAINAKGIRFMVEQDGKEVARAYLYLMHNDLHVTPFGLVEDVFVDEAIRGQGVGTILVNKIIETARVANCYKLIATSRTSRPKVHELYQRLGFEPHGIELRMNLSQESGGQS